jgi:hypothetical protein
MTATKPKESVLSSGASLRRFCFESNQRTTSACSKRTSLRKVPSASSKRDPVLNHSGNLCSVTVFPRTHWHGPSKRNRDSGCVRWLERQSSEAGWSNR